MRASCLLQVTHSHFYVAELGGINALTTSMYYGSNGLISAYGHLALVMTGTEAGLVRLDIDWTESEPAGPELDQWDEIVDVSMQFVDDDAAVFGPVDSDTQSLPTLPQGRYRVRACARGRDVGRAEPTLKGDPVEHHLLTAWPAAAQQETIHKATDEHGERVRSWS